MSDPFKQIATRRLPALPGNTSSTRFVQRSNSASGNNMNASSADDLYPNEEPVNRDFVKTYLASHQDVLDEFIMEFVQAGDLEQWLQRKQKNSTTIVPLNKLPLNCKPSSQGKYLETDLVKLQKTVGECLTDNPEDLYPALFEITNVIGMTLYADGCSLFIPKHREKELHLYVPNRNGNGYQLRACRNIERGTTVAAFVADSLEAVLISDLLEATVDDRFPHGIGHEGTSQMSALCVPVTLPSNDLIAVLEFTRSTEGNPFEERHLQSANAMVAWMGMVLHQKQVNRSLKSQTELNTFLLGVSKIIFDDIVTIDSLVRKIMTFTKKLVLADRCTMFLVDSQRGELYSDLLDEGKVDENGEPLFTKMSEIRFSISKGIAGLVARTGEVINITDAYNDARFNREIDMRTGYTTRTILCMPIISKGKVIGVVQMINKKDQDVFTNADENSFNTFAVFCALALHYSKVYREIQLRTAQFRVALEQVSYHARCTEEEHNKLIAYPMVEKHRMPMDLHSYSFYGPDSHKDVLPELYIEMVNKLSGPNSFELDKLSRFILTVRKNYRPVAYHNWNHAWNVSHCMFCILSRIKFPTRISQLRIKAMMIACLCHDIDHRGFNNTYFTAFSEPLAQLYSTSVMEQHHYAQTVSILQQEGHDLFASYTKEEYKNCLDWIKQAILATDLALFFGNQKSLSKLLLAGHFDLENQEHLDLVMAVMITACDLSSITKDWDTNLLVLNGLYEEMWQQGDLEKARGLDPIPMMNRDRKDHLSRDQVSFIQFVCLPCYQTLADIFPETEPLLNGCKDNLSQWQRLMEGKSTTMWQPEKSRVQDDEDDEDGEEEEGLEDVE